MKSIPIKAGKEIAKQYGYDQVVIIARAVGEGEHVTTYGINREHCDVAAQCGDFLKHKVMGWDREKRSCGECIYFKRDYGTHCMNGWSKDGSTGECLFLPGPVEKSANDFCSKFQHR